MTRSLAATGRELWRRRVEASPDDPFLHSEGRGWSYGEFDQEARRLAAGLAEIAGVERGDLVLVGMGNRHEALLSQLAITELGAVFVPLLPGLGFEELAYPVNHSGARILLADPESAGPLLPRFGELENLERVFVTADVEAAEGVAATPLAELTTAEPVPPRELDGYDDRSLAAVLYTSGSTGRPKGVMMPAGCFPSVGEAFSLRFGVGGSDVFLLAASLAHAVGSVTALSMTLFNGGQLHVLDRFSPSRFWDDVAAHGATCSVLFPAHLNLLLETELGAPAPGDLGVLDDEGRLFFVGRIKNVIKRSGENVSAEEVEEVIAAQPGVVETTVFGVPDRLRTEEVCAVVVRAAESELDATELRRGCAEKLIRWKLPRYVVLRDEPLPRLANGKLDRVTLRKALDLGRAWDAEAAPSA